MIYVENVHVMKSLDTSTHQYLFLGQFKNPSSYMLLLDTLQLIRVYFQSGSPKAYAFRPVDRDDAIPWWRYGSELCFDGGRACAGWARLIVRAHVRVRVADDVRCSHAAHAHTLGEIAENTRVHARAAKRKVTGSAYLKLPVWLVLLIMCTQ